MYKNPKTALQTVLEQLHDGKIYTKDSLAKATGYAKFTVSKCLKRLISEGQVTEGKSERLNTYQINPDLFHVATIEMYHIQRYSFYEFKSFNLHHEVVADDFIEDMDERLDALINEIKKFLEKDPLIKTLGISVTAPVNNGTVFPGAISYMDNMNLKALLEARFPIKAAIENDANAAVIGYISEHGDIDDAVLIYQPNNIDIGVGIIINKQLYKGRNGMTGELKYYHTNEMGNAVTYLKDSLQRVILLLNPEKVLIHSLVLDHLEFVHHLENIPEVMQPDVEVIKNIGTYFDAGLITLAIQAYLN